jgi:hypothetical protein
MSSEVNGGRADDEDAVCTAEQRDESCYVPFVASGRESTFSVQF